MLASGNEYLIRMLGVSGSTATPGPDEVAQGLPYTEIEMMHLGPEYALTITSRSTTRLR